MTAALSHELFPYGAPELARSRRPFLIASLLLSCTLVTLSFLLAWLVSSLLPSARLVEVPTVPRFEIEHGRVPIPPLIVPAPPRVKIRTARENAVPVPRPEASAPPEGPILGTEAGEKSEGTEKTPPAAKREGGAERDDIPPNIPGEPPLVDELPVPTVRVKPLYSEIAREVRVEGLVLVYVLVGRDGRVRDARLDADKHVPLLDASALEAARQWRFEPALTGGHPVAVWVSLPFRYSLHGEER